MSEEYRYSMEGRREIVAKDGVVDETLEYLVDRGFDSYLSEEPGNWFDRHDYHRHDLGANNSVIEFYKRKSDKIVFLLIDDKINLPWGRIIFYSYDYEEEKLVPIPQDDEFEKTFRYIKTLQDDKQSKLTDIKNEVER